MVLIDPDLYEDNPIRAVAEAARQCAPILLATLGKEGAIDYLDRLVDQHKALGDVGSHIGMRLARLDIKTGAVEPAVPCQVEEER